MGREGKEKRHGEEKKPRNTGRERGEAIQNTGKEEGKGGEARDTGSRGGKEHRRERKPENTQEGGVSKTREQAGSPQSSLGSLRPR